MKTKTIASICFIFCSIQLWSTNKLPMTSDNCKTFLTSENEHGWSIGTTTSWNNNDGRTYSFVVEWDGVPGKISIEATRDGGTCNTTNYSDFYIYYKIPEQDWVQIKHYDKCMKDIGTFSFNNDANNREVPLEARLLKIKFVKNKWNNEQLKVKSVTVSEGFKVTVDRQEVNCKVGEEGSVNISVITNAIPQKDIVVTTNDISENIGLDNEILNDFITNASATETITARSLFEMPQSITATLTFTQDAIQLAQQNIVYNVSSSANNLGLTLNYNPDDIMVISPYRHYHHTEFHVYYADTQEEMALPIDSVEYNLTTFIHTINALKPGIAYDIEEVAYSDETTIVARSAKLRVVLSQPLPLNFYEAVFQEHGNENVRIAAGQITDNGRLSFGANSELVTQFTDSVGLLICELQDKTIQNIPFALFAGIDSTSLTDYSSYIIGKNGLFMASLPLNVQAVKISNTSAMTQLVDTMLITNATLTPPSFTPVAQNNSVTVNFTETDNYVYALLDINDSVVASSTQFNGQQLIIDNLERQDSYTFICHRIDPTTKATSQQVTTTLSTLPFDAVSVSPATNITLSGFTANWAAVADAEQYVVVWYEKSSDDYTEIGNVTLDAPATSYNVALNPARTSGNKLYYVVHFLKGDKLSQVSEIIEVTF